MEENFLEKLVDLLFNAFQEKYLGVDLSPQGMSECFFELSSTLNYEQKQLLQKLDYFEVETYVNSVKALIRYFLTLLNPNN